MTEPPLIVPDLEREARLRSARDFITHTYGERCETRDRDDFPDLTESDGARCACCEQWDHHNEWAMGLTQQQGPARSDLWSQGDSNP